MALEWWRMDWNEFSGFGGTLWFALSEVICDDQIKTKRYLFKQTKISRGGERESARERERERKRAREGKRVIDKRGYSRCTNEHTYGSEEEEKTKKSSNDIFITHTTPVKNK